jgi:hypothetical protein
MHDQSSKGPRGGKTRLSRERRHVLQILASSEQLGVTEAIIMAHGLSTAMLAGMLCDGLVTVVVETVCADDRSIKVRKFRITDAGRKLIGVNERSSAKP